MALTRQQMDEMQGRWEAFKAAATKLREMAAQLLKEADEFDKKAAVDGWPAWAEHNGRLHIERQYGSQTDEEWADFMEKWKEDKVNVGRETMEVED